jgi:transposase-like protein
MARNYTPEENERRVAEYQQMVAAGCMMREIAAHWGCSLTALREWRDAHGLGTPKYRIAAREKREPRPDVDAARNAPKMERSCCTCGKSFLSTRADGAWLRMCDYCRGRPLSPYTPGGAGHPGRRVGVTRP